MNILFLFVSLPTLSSSNGLFSLLIKEFKKNGHKVFVSSRGDNLEQTRIVEESGIPVLRIKSPEYTRVRNVVKKAMAYQVYVIKQHHYILKYWKKEKIDIIISHSLPPEIAYVVGGLKRHFRCQFYLEVTDFTWQDAVAFGYFKKNGLIGLYYRFWEHKMFSIADYIGVPTKGNERYIRKLYPRINEQKFQVFPYWQIPLDIKKDNTQKNILGLGDKFVVVYGGSIGGAQRIENFVELADSCASYPDMVFLIIGRGPELPKIKIIVEKRKISNIIFKDFIPQQDYLSLLAVCDVGMILLNENLATPNAPSKALSYLNLMVPILAALDHVTDFGEFLEENGAGLWDYSDNIEGLKTKLLKYYNSEELRIATAKHGRELFLNTMLPECAYKSICSQIGIDKK